MGLQHMVTGLVFLDLARHVQACWLDANDADLATLQAKLQQQQRQRAQQGQPGQAGQTAAQAKALAAGRVLAEHLVNNHSSLLAREVQQQLGALVFVPATLGIPGAPPAPALGTARPGAAASHSPRPAPSARRPPPRPTPACPPAFPPAGSAGALQVLASYERAALEADWPLTWTVLPVIPAPLQLPPGVAGSLRVKSPPPFATVLQVGRLRRDPGAAAAASAATAAACDRAPGPRLASRCDDSIRGSAPRSAPVPSCPLSRST